MHYAVAIGMLGFTRLQSVVAYNSETRGFDEITPAAARRLIKSGQIAGILWEEDADLYDGGKFLPDKEGFGKQNIMVKTAAGKYRPLLNDSGVAGQTVNSMYSVVRIIKTNYRGVLYEVVSNRCDRIKLTEQQLRGLYSIEPVGGIWLQDDHIITAACIKVEDRTQPSGESEEQIESGKKPDPVETGESGESAEPVESTESVETVESAEPVAQSNEPQTMDDVFGAAGVAEGEQATENESQASENENQDMDQPEQAEKMSPVFETVSGGQEQNKNTGSKAAGGKNKKSAANKRK